MPRFRGMRQSPILFDSSAPNYLMINKTYLIGGILHFSLVEWRDELGYELHLITYGKIKIIGQSSLEIGKYYPTRHAMLRMRRDRYHQHHNNIWLHAMRSDDGVGFGVRMSVWSKLHVVAHIDMTTYQLHEC